MSELISSESYMKEATQFLLEEFSTRQKKDLKYSKRSFAKDINLAPSHLIYVLNGKKAISKDKAIHIGERLNWSEEKCRHFAALWGRISAKHPLLAYMADSALASTRTDLVPMETLSEDRFKVISDWYHFAIAELVELPDFQNTAEWIAKRLNIAPDVAAPAVERLIRVGVLVLTEEGLKKSNTFYGVPAISSEAIRSFHKQHLEKAQNALDEQSVDERDITGITLAIDPANLPLAKKMLVNQMKELMNLLESGDKKSVYQFSVQLFRLDKDSHETK